VLTVPEVDGKVRASYEAEVVEAGGFRLCVADLLLWTERTDLSEHERGRPRIPPEGIHQTCKSG
jgi:hypothetical protein